MNKKTFTYNESGALDENKFTKYGYEFIGWTGSNGGKAAIARTFLPHSG